METTSVDDALRRLVSSIVGDDSQELTNNMAIAHRILSSNSHSSLTNTHSATMRRVERAHGKDIRVKVEELHRELLGICDQQPSLADDIVNVLSKISLAQQQYKPAKSRILSATPPILDWKQTQRTVDTTPIDSLDDEEVLFLRECFYVLQGVDGQHVQLVGKQMIITSTPAIVLGRSTLVTHSRLGSGALTALKQCAETGWYASRVTQFVENASNGFCTLALAQALRKELHKYHEMMAVMDRELHHEASTLTLRQILLNLHAPTQRLRILAMIADGLVYLRGGQLLSGLYRHSLHGDTRHASLVNALLLETSKPWFETLYIWTTEGMLCDPHAEFFITEDKDVDEDHMWENKYSVDLTRVPIGIMNPTLVEPALLVGKSISFIRTNLQDLEWCMEYDTPDEDEPIERLGYTADGSSTLRLWLNNALDQVNSHILGSLRADLLQHLWALKQFLLLGQGDFFSVLMTGLHTEFEGKAGIVGIYSYVLMGIVDSAIKSTNAAKLPASVLDRLQVELDVDADDETQYMFAEPKNGEYKDARTGWDIFMLKYVVPDRLTAILGEGAMNKYRQIFSMLFQMKRVEFMLASTWRQSTSLQHALQSFAQYNGIRSSTNEDYANALSLLRRISMTRQSMTHFVTNLKSYLFFEVLEGSWKLLVYQVEHAKSLDEVISAHNQYLDDIMHKSLLSESTEHGKKLANQIKILLDLALLFCTFQEQLFSHALDAADRAAEKRRIAETRMKVGEWGFETEHEIAEENTFFGLVDQEKFHEATAIYDQFNLKTLELTGGLEEAINGISSAHIIVPGTPSSPTRTGNNVISSKAHFEVNHDSLRFLTFQLDYSSFYNAQIT